jgi:hypothetical protein
MIIALFVDCSINIVLKVIARYQTLCFTCNTFSSQPLLEVRPISCPYLIRLWGRGKGVRKGVGG